MLTVFCWAKRQWTELSLCWLLTVFRWAKRQWTELLLCWLTWTCRFFETETGRALALTPAMGRVPGAGFRLPEAAGRFPWSLALLGGLKPWKIVNQTEHFSGTMVSQKLPFLSIFPQKRNGCSMPGFQIIHPLALPPRSTEFGAL